MTLFLIGGCPRSGTTLLQNILCSDPSTNPVIGEVGYLYHLVEAYSGGKADFESQSQYFFTDLEALRQFSANLVKAFLTQVQSQYPSATHLVLKYPLLSRYFPDLFELVQDVKFLITIRDPRDTIASLIQVGDRMKTQQPQNRHFTSLFQSRNIPDYLNFYVSAYASAWNHSDPNFKQKIRYLKYEYLIENPKAALQDLQQFTGLSLEQFEIEGSWQRNLVPHGQLNDAARAFDSTLYNQGFCRDRLHHYTQVLTPEEIEWIEREGQDVLSNFAYPVQGSHGSRYSPDP